MAALAFDGEWGGAVGWQIRYVGATDTGRSNAYFVASLNGGQFHLGWHGPPWPPVEPPLLLRVSYATAS